MSLISIQNKQKRAWTIPPIHREDNSFAHKAVAIEPGRSAQIESDHWDLISKDNKVIQALVGQRLLVVTRNGKQREDIVDTDELQNPKPVDAPADLTEKDDRVKVDSKVELKEVALKDDAPAQGKGRK